jgi:hypothetical protein
MSILSALVDQFTGHVTPCARCGRTEHLVDDDGASICRACILRYGDIVRRPERLTQGEALLLAAAHGDVTALGFDACVHVGAGDVLAWWHYIPTWRWIAPGWPEAGEPASEDLDAVIARRLAELGRHER